jgi:hypothetical protein
MTKIIKAVKPKVKENCCGRRIKRQNKRKIVYKKTIKKR